ncbi:hypothetical protein COU58_03550 [Candidatus Pacearchaeota archaeon CG10_big_fil_rev_8_21_14_0_10_32_42]|nr:MAG: hypothetical protein COU58_03550 [Candidatus Pacearchaeota archaeon CG10_big_fil_rev_8_21_14_0_10_32_42]
MVNQSKIKDSRFWKKWKKSGATPEETENVKTYYSEFLKTGIDISKRMYQETANLFYQLTGRNKEEASEGHECSPGAGLCVLNALGLEQDLYTTNFMIGCYPVGKDIVWLAIARAKTFWWLNHREKIPKNQYRNTITTLDRVIDSLYAPAEKEYNFNYVGYARGLKVLGVSIKYHSPFEFK